jgi:ribonuclease P protein component
LKKEYRIKKEQEFASIMKKKDSCANKKFVLYKDEESCGHFRVGLSVGKKIGKAHTRNAVKRKIRQALYELREEISPDYKFIVIARPKTEVEELDFFELKKNLRHVLKVGKIIK